jgi:AraC family transcriptional regulator, ethanolamine operon transcriptional activator
MNPDQGPVSVQRTAIETIDVCQHSDSYRGWDLNIKQFSRGRFKGAVHELNFLGLQVLLEESNVSLLKNGVSRDGVLVVSIPVIEPGTRLQGVSDRPMMIVSPGEQLPEVMTPEGFRALTLTIVKDEIQALADSVNEHLFLHSAPEYYAATLDCQAALVPRLLSPDIVTNNDYTDLKNTIFLNIIDVVAAKSFIKIDFCSKKKVVKRAVSFYLDNISDPPSIADICLAIGTSRGRLQYSFQDVVGMSPLSYFKTLQLNCIHSDLYRTSGKVSDIAANYGVFHLSRLSGDYKKFFGHLPSDTRRMIF